MVEFDEIYSMLFSGSIGIAGVDVTAGQGHHEGGTKVRNESGST
jgi:hypothetical protein